MTATRKQALKNQISGDSGTCTEMWRNGFWTLTFRMPTANGAACPRKTPWSSSPGAPHIVRGGSWEDDPDSLRSAARRASTPAWNRQDPQNPKSIWYLTDGGMIGFRVVRPHEHSGRYDDAQPLEFLQGGAVKNNPS